MRMRSRSTTPRADSSLPDRERRSRRRARPKSENKGKQRDSAVPNSCREYETGSGTAEFVALCQALTSANHLLLLSIDEVIASVRAPEAQLYLDAIASQARSIRDQISLMAKLAADLKDTGE